MKFESAMGGSNEEKFNFISSRLGKEIKVSELIKNGEFVDISSITKGKGWAGAIKRFGVARLYHKATNKIRHVGTLGPFTPGKVLFTVPQAGQLGFNYRTETTSAYLKMGTAAEAATINPKSGFTNYGNVKSDYIIVKGSVGGPAKRLVRIRKSVDREQERDKGAKDKLHINKHLMLMDEIDVLSLEGKSKGKIALPSIFADEVRPELIQRAVLAENTMQAAAAGPLSLLQECRQLQDTTDVCTRTEREGTWEWR